MVMTGSTFNQPGHLHPFVNARATVADPVCTRPDPTGKLHLNMRKIDPIRPTDTEAISLTAELIRGAGFAALGVHHPDNQHPHLTRIALGLGPENQLLTLISELSLHTRALRQNPHASLLIGEPGDKGDPLTYPRISLFCKAEFVERSTDRHAGIRAAYLADHPKSKLYIDFSDFWFVEFAVLRADLNGGFGKAYALTPNEVQQALSGS